MTQDDIITDADALADEAEPEIVHWYAPRPVRLSPPQALGALTGAFVLGAVTAVAALALSGHLKD